MSDCARTLEPGIAFALLAAGSARRFGGTKLGVEIAGKPLLNWAADAVREAGFRTRLLIVSSSSSPDFGLEREDWTIVSNPDAATGIASSIRTAAASCHGYDRLVLSLADMPFVSSEHYRALALSAGVVFTRYPSGRSGVPAAFDRRGMVRLSSLEGDKGANTLVWKGAKAIAPPSPHELLDVDTADDLAKARSIAHSR